MGDKVVLGIRDYRVTPSWQLRGHVLPMKKRALRILFEFRISDEAFLGKTLEVGATKNFRIIVAQCNVNRSKALYGVKMLSNCNAQGLLLWNDRF